MHVNNFYVEARCSSLQLVANGERNILLLLFPGRHFLSGTKGYYKSKNIFIGAGVARHLQLTPPFEISEAHHALPPAVLRYIFTAQYIERQRGKQKHIPASKTKK